MLYRFAYQLMHITFRIYFRNIEVVNRHSLLKNQPAILVANHPASFLDAMVLAVFLKRPLYFYVRGDIFKHPLAYRILTILHMIPIFSLEHGISNMGKNQSTFERGRSILKKGGLLLVFPEGVSRLSKKLMPLKKGASRVALQTAFENSQDFPLIFQTVAIHYSRHNLGANLLIRVGEQLSLDSYGELYRENPNKAILQLTKDLQEVFERNVIHVAEAERTNHVEDLIELDYSNRLSNPGRFEQARSICQQTDTLSQDEFNIHVGMMDKYTSILKKYQIFDRCIVREEPALLLFFETSMLLPVFLVGSLLWFLPFRLARYIADTKVTRIDFYTSVFSAALALLAFLWWLLLLLAGYIFGNLTLTLIMILSPAWAYGAVRWLDNWKLIRAFWNYNELKELQPQLVSELKGIRKKLFFQ